MKDLTPDEVKALLWLIEWTARPGAEWRVQHLVSSDEMQRSGEDPGAGDVARELFALVDAARTKLAS